MSRVTARRHAFNMIYQIPFHPEADKEDFARLRASYYDFLDEDGLKEYGLVGFNRPKGNDNAYIDRVVWGVIETHNWIDDVIDKFLQDWTVERISRVDLAILRLSIFEILRERDIPHGVSVNEAVELAKVYGQDDSPSFINGVLAGVAKEANERGGGYK